MISSKDPRPILASPSVHKTTEEPGLPFDAKTIDVSKAGPRAVGPVSSRDRSFLASFSPV